MKKEPEEAATYKNINSKRKTSILTRAGIVLLKKLREIQTNKLFTIDS